MREEEREIRRGGGGSQTIIDFKGNFHKTFREYSSQSSASMSPASVLVSCPAQLLAESRPEKQGPRQTQHWISECSCWSSWSLTHAADGDPRGLVSWLLQFFFIAFSPSDVVFNVSWFIAVISVTPGTLSACSLLYLRLLEKLLVEQIESAQ